MPNYTWVPSAQSLAPRPASSSCPVPGLLTDRVHRLVLGPSNVKSIKSFKISLCVLQSLGLEGGGGTRFVGGMGVGGLVGAEGECCGCGWSQGWQAKRRSRSR